MSCFVSEKLTGNDNTASILNDELKTIFPLDLGPNGASKHYLSIRRDGGAFKNSFPVDWETKEGQEYINENYPGFLGPQGEPKLYVDKIGRAYFKKPGGFHYINKSTISENERYENVKALMASYVAENNVDLKTFIKESALKNIHVLDDILFNTESKLDEYLEVFSNPATSESSKKEIASKMSFLENDVTTLNKNITFLLSVANNNELLDILFHDVKLALETSKIAYDDDIYTREEDNANASIELGFLRPSNESNPTNSVPAEILQLISTVPKTELKFSENGDIAIHEKTASDLMPLLTYINDYSDVFKEIQKVLKDTVPSKVNVTAEEINAADKKTLEKIKDQTRSASLYNVMMDKLNTYISESNSNIATEVVARMEKLVASQKSDEDKQNVRAKFVKAFHKAKSNNVMHTASTGILEVGPNAGSEMININKIDLSNEDVRADLLASEMTMKSFVTLNSSRSKQETHEINEAFLGLLSAESFQQTKDNLKTYLEKKYGIVIHDKTASQLISYINKNPEPKKGQTKVTEFLMNLKNLNSLRYKKSEIIIQGQKENPKYSIENLAKDYEKASPSEKETIIDNFVFNGGVPTEMKKIAEFEYNNSPSSADSSIAVGAKKVWLYSFMSKMQKDIISWKNGDLSQLEALRDTGNGMVDFLLGKQNDGTYNQSVSQKRIDGISLKNNMELRNRMDSNPSEFDQLTEEDLLLMTFSNLYENRKEKYVQRELGGSARVGENIELQEMMAGKETAGEFIFLNNADKTQTLSFAGILKGDSDIIFNDQGQIINIGRANTERLKGLVYGELNKISKIKSSIDIYSAIEDKDKKLSFAMKNLIPGWHYAPVKGKDYSKSENVISNEEFLKGNYRQFGFMNGFYNANKRKMDLYLFDSSPSRGVFPGYSKLLQSDFNLDEMLNDYFIDILQEEIKDITSMTGFSSKSEPRKGLFEIQTSVIHDGFEINQNKTAGDFLMNYMFHSVDLFNIMNGEIGMYKQKGTEFNMMDALKRTSAVNADGIYTNNPNPTQVDYYVPFGEKFIKKNGKLNPKAIPYLKNSKSIFAVINSQTYDQSFYGPLINKVIEDNNKNNYIVLSGEVSDGASYSNPRFLIDFYERSYGLSEEERSLHNELMNPNFEPTQKHFDFLKKLGGSNQAGKLQAFSLLKKQDSTIAPLFWKSSVIPLYPSLTNGFHIDKLRQSMERQGVDVVGNQSAFKSLTHAATEIFKPNSEDNKLGNMVDLDNMNLNPFEVDTDDIKIQVELSAKGDKESVTGNQPLRNVIANMNLDSEEKVYNYKGRSLTAKQMLNAYDSNIKDIIQDQLSSFLDRINYIGGSYDDSIFRKMITDQMTDLDYDIKNIVENTDMPLETIPGMSNRIYPIISSFIHKNVSKPKTNGTAAIQVANTGFNSLSSSEKQMSVIFEPGAELKPPRPTSFQDYSKQLLNTYRGEEKIAYLEAAIDAYNESRSDEDKFDKVQSPLYFSTQMDEDSDTLISLEKIPGYYARIEEGNIMLPFSSIFKDSKMTWDEFMKFAGKKDEEGNLIGIDQRILENIIGYRIPNQSMSSNDAFKVIGILHPSVGDSAIMYHEITAKTGSDFDIDKMVLMLPNFETIYEIRDEKTLSKENKNAIDRIFIENPVSKFMLTGDYRSTNQVYNILLRNDRLKEFADNNLFYEMNDQQRVDFFLQNKRQIKWFVQRDNRKGSIVNKTIYSIKDVLNDFYDAEELQEGKVDSELELEGFKPRKRYIASRFNYIDDESTEGMQNRLIESIKSILKSSQTFDDLISPLDGTHIKDSINEVRYEYYLANLNEGRSALDEFRNKDEKTRKSEVNEYLNSQSKSLVASMMPKYLAKSRTDMLMAKGLTATMANHMTNIPLAQIQKVFLKYDIGMGISSLSRTHIIGKEDFDDFKITKMVSYLMNASVDAAKDPYIIEGNYNRYTSGAAMLFVRLGIDPYDAAKIIQHPLIVALSKEKIGSTSKIANISSSYTNDDLDNMTSALVSKIKKGLRITPEAFMANLYENKTENVPLNQRNWLDTNEILGFWNLAVSIGKDLNTAIQLSKPDSTGAGKTTAEMHVISNLHDIAPSNSFASFDRMGDMIGNGLVFNTPTTGIHPFVNNVTTQYDEQDNYISGLEGNYNAAISNASVSLVNELTRNSLIERTPGYTELLNKISINLGNGHSISVNKIKKLSSTLYPFVLATSGHEIYQFIESREDGISDMNDMINVLPKDVLKLKARPEFLDNNFLKEINVDDSKGFISFNNTANYSELSKIAIKDASSTLYSNPETRDIMIRLVKYSYLTTGFKPSSYSFTNYLPKQYFIDSEHDVAMKVLLEKLNNGNSYVESNLENALMFIASNRPEDSNVYKKLKGTNSQLFSGVPVTNKSTVRKLLYKDPDTKDMKFYPFVSISKRTGVLNYALTDPGIMEDGVPSMPVYSLINVMQYNSNNEFSDKLSDEDIALEEQDEIGDMMFEADQKRIINSSERYSRLNLFNPYLSTRETFFVQPDNQLYYTINDNNVTMKNNSMLFDMNYSQEALDGFENKKQMMENGLIQTETEANLELNPEDNSVPEEVPLISEINSNNDVYEYLKNTVSLSPEEFDFFKRMIDDYFEQDKNIIDKQKAVNELDKFKECK